MRLRRSGGCGKSRKKDHKEHNDMCVIISDETVITLYEVPVWFKKANRYSGKERIRNQAKFAKYNRNSSEASWVM